MDELNKENYKENYEEDLKEENVKQILQELKINPIINKVYLSKITFFNGGISLILVLVGLILIFYSLANRDSLEEFFLYPFLLGIIDLIFSTFYFYKNIGYSLHFNSTILEYKKFGKTIFKSNVKYTDIEYKKGLLYDYYKISNIVDRRQYIIIPSFIFSKKDFLEIKDDLSKLMKLKQVLKSYK